jgi:hypothetical protein
MIRKIINWFKLKSPCCDAIMHNNECHDAFGDMPIYECSKCNVKYI